MELLRWIRTRQRNIAGIVQAKRRTGQTELSVFEVSPFAFNHAGKGNDLPADTDAAYAGHPFPTYSMSEVQRKGLEKRLRERENGAAYRT